MQPQDESQIIYLALGANLGNREANLRAAIERLRAAVRIDRASSIYETEPAYVLDQPRFLNMALRGATRLDPAELLAFLKQIEHDLGRVSGLRFGPRAIDLDILLYGDLALATPELTIPHPRMAERPFVLVPLAEIAPDLLPRGWSATVGHLAQTVQGNGDVLVCQGALADVANENLAGQG